jgi:hypothetical protein
MEPSTDLDQLKDSPANSLTGTPLSLLDLHRLLAGAMSRRYLRQVLMLQTKARIRGDAVLTLMTIL